MMKFIIINACLSAAMFVASTVAPDKISRNLFRISGLLFAIAVALKFYGM